MTKCTSDVSKQEEEAFQQILEYQEIKTNCSTSYWQNLKISTAIVLKFVWAPRNAMMIILDRL